MKVKGELKGTSQKLKGGKPYYDDRATPNVAGSDRDRVWEICKKTAVDMAIRAACGRM